MPSTLPQQPEPEDPGSSQGRAERLQQRLDDVLGMVDAISEAIYIQDDQGRFLNVNEGAVRMYGLPRSFFIGKTPDCVSAPGLNDLEALGVAFGKALQGEPQQFEFWGLRGDGSIFPKEVRLYPGRQHGAPVVIAVAQDITRRKRGEQVQSAVFRIAEAATTAPTLPALFALVHEALRDLMPADNLFFALWDPVTDIVSFPYWVDEMDPAPTPRPRRRGLTDYLLRTGEPLWLTEDEQAQLFDRGDLEHLGTPALEWCGLPLRSPKGIYGAMVLQNYQGGRAYTAEERQVLTFVASQVSQAVGRHRVQQEQRLFTEAIDRSAESIFGIGREGRFQFVNRSACRTLGYTAEELLRASVWEVDPLLTPQDWAARWEYLHARGARVAESLHRRRDGSTFPVELTSSFLESEGREVVFTHARDITGRKASEAALRASERRLKTVLANSPVIIYHLNSEGRILLSEGLGLSVLGLRPGELVGQNALALYADNPTVIRQMSHALKGIPSREITHVGGRVFENLITPVFDDQDLVESAIGISTDITDRHQAEVALLAERGLFVGGPVMVFKWRAVEGWPVAYASPNVASILGYPLEELLEQRIVFESLIHPEDLPRVLREIQGHLGQGRRHFDQEYRLRTASGAYRWFYDFTAAADDQPAPSHYLGYLLDITERRLSEESLRQSQKLESLGVLAGGIAHDFNNLLTVLLGNLNLAQLQLPEASPALPHLANMEATILRATDLTQQMLAYSGRGHFVVKPQDLNGLVRELAHLLEVSISKKVRLRFDLAPDLPAIEGDSAQLQQVLMNLVTNASEAIGDAEGTIRLTTSLQRLDAATLRDHYRMTSPSPGRYVLLQVDDTGGGMPPEVIDRIFDPFFTTKATGRGLGLSAMLGILQSHGGGLNLTSACGQGTSFRLCFPALREAPAPAPPTAEPTPRGTLRGQVLVVDDEPQLLDVVASALTALGFEVERAMDGLEAVERFKALHPSLSLVLMDLTMPRMDGWEAFLAMRAIAPTVPVVLCSGYSEQEAMRPGTDLAPAAFLQKPFQLRMLRTTLASVLGH